MFHTSIFPRLVHSFRLAAAIAVKAVVATRPPTKAKVRIGCSLKMKEMEWTNLHVTPAYKMVNATGGGVVR
jgi:hypothetical protein